MIGPIERQTFKNQPVGFHCRSQTRPRRLVAYQHRLVRAVVHAHEHPAACLFNQRSDLVQTRANSQHERARRFGVLRHLFIHLVEVAQMVAHKLILAHRDHARRQQRRVLPSAMADHGIRLYAKFAQQCVDGGVACQHRLYCAVDLPELLGYVGVACLPRCGEDEVAGDIAARVPGEDVVDAVECGAHFREMQTQVGQHVGILGPFARE